MPDVMTNLEWTLNGVKNRVWTAQQVTSNEVWNPLANDPTEDNTRDALELLRSVSSSKSETLALSNTS